MTPALVIILPADLADAPEWLRVAGDAIVARGRGEDWGTPPDDPDAILLVAPAATITLHRTMLPDLAARQAIAAARLLALESSLGGADTLHAATGPRASDGELDVAVVRNTDMAAWLLWAQHHALDPGAIVPAATLLPRPESGFTAAAIGDERILRDASSALLDDGIGAYLIGDAPVEVLAQDAIDAALVAALAAPALNLRQGAFARRTRRTLDWKTLRRSGVLAGLILITLLATTLIRIVRLHADSAAQDAAAVAMAHAIAPTVTTADEADAAVHARLAARGLGGRSFSGPAAQLVSAMQNVPDVTMTTLARTGDGTLTTTLSAASVDEIDAVLLAVQNAGYVVTAEPPLTQSGRNAVAITVSAP
ncbi:type II secretion system protein L (GspL) [Hephaestia caeni]|uniref:Type II secretion system protein L (GspL) n=1 Tax=Hephaestia caeni TaxID=645617 RepID=A0A397PEC8_9SPHN|nr:type II secretion system protein GspL [Hephaestia caeni]RIA45575.1 type II secretion system protein L (GspL) [Hephaestia caeni]